MAVPRKRRSKPKLSNLKRNVSFYYNICSNCRKISFQRLCRNCLEKKNISDNVKII